MPADDERAAQVGLLRRGGEGVFGGGGAGVAAALLGRGKGAEPLVLLLAPPAGPAFPRLLPPHPSQEAVAPSSPLGRTPSGGGGISAAAIVVVVVAAAVVVKVPRRERAAQGPRDRVEDEHRRPPAAEHDGAAVGGERRGGVDEVGDARREPREAPPAAHPDAASDGRFDGRVGVEGAVDSGDQRGAAVVAAARSNSTVIAVAVAVAAAAAAVPVPAPASSSASSEPTRGDQRAPAVKGPQRGSRGGLDGDEGAVEQGDEQRVGGRKRPVFFFFFLRKKERAEVVEVLRIGAIAFFLPLRHLSNENVSPRQFIMPSFSR